MIKIKTLIEVTESIPREDLKDELQDLTLDEFKDYVIQNGNPQILSDVKNVLGDEYVVRIKKVNVVERKRRTKDWLLLRPLLKLQEAENENKRNEERNTNDWMFGKFQNYLP